LVAQGVLDSSKPLNTDAGQWVPWPQFNPYLAGGGYEKPGECWEDIPVLTVPAWLRADTDRCGVGDRRGRAA
jgi:hypothetical protein